MRLKAEMGMEKMTSADALMRSETEAARTTPRGRCGRTLGLRALQYDIGAREAGIEEPLRHFGGSVSGLDTRGCCSTMQDRMVVTMGGGGRWDI